MQSIISPYIEGNQTLILDGGLATELEQRGHDLNDSLWSTKLLIEDPQTIKSVHLDYIYAGADCVITSTYQATFQELLKRGYSHAEATHLFELSVSLAKEAVEAFWEIQSNRSGRRKPLVAASIGPYGAYLADGSEYTGAYGLPRADLKAFHAERWHLLATQDADLFACETIPSFTELQAFGDLLQETPHIQAWFCFSCKDDKHISDGTPLAECASFLEGIEQAVAVGVNCTAPQYIPSLISQIEAVSNKPIIVYPNSGEHYHPETKSWSGTRHPEEYGTAAKEWRKCGAALIGGCCRTTPAHIQAIAGRMRIQER